MWEEILKAIPVYFFSMLKFVFGPFGGYVVGLNLVTTILTTVAGMMTAVILFTFFGDFMRNKVLSRVGSSARKKKFSERTRNFVRFWRKYGIVGVAALTPILLTPVGGTILAVSFGAPKKQLILYMFISAAIWSVILSATIYILGNEVTAVIGQYFELPDGLKKP